MNAREKILAKLRKSRVVPRAIPDRLPDISIYSDHPGDEANQFIDRFQQKFKNLAGEFHLAASLAEAANRIDELLQSAEVTRFCTDMSPLCRELFAQAPALLSRFETIDACDRSASEFATFAVGLTGADFLVARTGSIVLRSEIAGGRRLSVLPPLHIVLARQSQIVASLDAVLQTPEYSRGDWRYGTIITGPSRTSDIEKILVLGAHGPKRLAVVMVES